MKPRTVWIAAAAIWLAFFAWYTNLGGPLTPEEIDHYTARMGELRDVDDEARVRFRRFLESDTGDDFLMLNLIEMHEEPVRIEGVGPDDSAADVLARYMAYMWPALLRRACHPVVFGSAAAETLETWGIDGGGRWTRGALMRYRSRRDLLEIAVRPEFNGPHEFKIAAMKRTIAIPLDPFVLPGDLRLLLGLVLFGAAAALHLRLR